MTLANTILEKLADWRPEGRQTLTLPGEGSGWTVAITADRSDALGCLVWEMIVRRSSDAAGGDLRTWAERVAERATGLLEPLQVVEVDTLRGQALLRSEQPARRGEQLFYYEVLLTGNREASLRRYSAARIGEGRREQVAFVLTHEALAKLAGDLTIDG